MGPSRSFERPKRVRSKSKKVESSKPEKAGLSGFKIPTSKTAIKRSIKTVKRTAYLPVQERAQGPKMDKDQARDLARLVLNRDDKKKPATIADQKAKYARFNGQTLDQYARKHIRTKGSWYCHKAAYQRGLAVDIRKALNASDKAKKAGDKEGARTFRAQAMAFATQLRDLAPDYRKQHQHNSEIKSRYNGPENRRHGHKYRTQGIKKGWREDVLEQLEKTNNTHQMAALVSAMTGCRPEELLPGEVKHNGEIIIRHGVEISRTEDGMIRADIVGAKVTDDAGHPERTIIFTQENPFAKRMDDHMKAIGQKHLIIKIERKQSFLNAISRAGKRLDLKGINPYAFRNQMGSDLKLMCKNLKGRQLQEALKFRADVLGHRSPVTGGAYGFSSQGGSHGISSASGTAPAPAVGGGPSMG